MKRARVAGWYGSSFVYDDPAPPKPKEKKHPERTGRKPKGRAGGPAPASPKGRGVVLGRFLPPHRGHEYLIDVARAWCAHVNVVVCATASDPIPGEQRGAWLRELFPDTRVVVVEGRSPVAFASRAEFEKEWLERIRPQLLVEPELLFSSEAYGPELAKLLNARHVAVDPERTTFPVSASAVRADPLAQWPWLSPCVRAHLVPRVALVGPEGTGKTTLAGQLAAHYQTVWAPEDARVALAGRSWAAVDTDPIARGQMAREDALARQANRVLITDGDLLQVKLWNKRLNFPWPAWAEELRGRRAADLYLVPELDLPYSGPALDWIRDEFFGRALDEIDALELPYARVGGTGDERLKAAIAAVDELLARPRPIGPQK